MCRRGYGEAMTTIFDHGVVRITKLAVGPFDNNAYVVSSAGRAVIIDAAAEPERILAACDGFAVESVLTTHGHGDHIGALGDVTAALGVPWYLHSADIEIAGRSPDLLLADGDGIVVGDVTIRVLHTPGHTPGSVCFRLEPAVFSGDTLFPGGPGATRWDYSSFDNVLTSIETRLLALPDDTIVHPGHGPDTTIGAERPHLPGWRSRGW